jgi:hypothetical protein
MNDPGPARSWRWDVPCFPASAPGLPALSARRCGGGSQVPSVWHTVILSTQAPSRFPRPPLCDSHLARPPPSKPTSARTPAQVAFPQPHEPSQAPVAQFRAARSPPRPPRVTGRPTGVQQGPGHRWQLRAERSTCPTPPARSPPGLGSRAPRRRAAVPSCSRRRGTPWASF